MKYQFKRGMSAMLALVLVISLFSGLVVPAQAATVKNYGYRGNTATMFSSYATNFYSKNDVTYEDLAALSGSSDVSSVPSSALYLKLKDLMTSNHTYINSYKESTEYFAYTDCQGEGDVISSFYSGKDIGPEWDSGATWNREHTWPNSKGLEGSDEDDIMMLRPTASSENSARGNKAYGISSGFYNPNTVSNGLYNLHGDVARIALYVYVRWGNTSNMWGSEGVIESKEVLLDWMQEDPVDTWELGRNDAVMSITGTRNVFVDYPELAFLLFNEEVPAGMTTPSGSNAASYTVTATVNDATMGSVTVAGSNIKAVPADGYRVEGYEVVSGEATVTQNGDVFTVSAKSDCTVQINFGIIPVPETLAEQLEEASKLEYKEYLPYTTTIQGKVSSIAEAYNTQYKNICFYVNVDGTDVYCYRVKGDGMDTLAVGDTVKVVGNLTAYNNVPQFDSTATVTVIEKAEVDTPVVPDEPEETVGVMIDFSVIGQRVSQTSTKQVWQNDGITVTNNKAKSTNDVADYSNPARFYKNSEVIVEYPGMTKVVFHCTGGSKYYMKTSDVAHLGTATADGGVITLVLDAPVDSITFTCASNQIRCSKIEVYAEKTEEEGCKHENLEHTEAIAADCTTAGNVAYWYCPDCQIYWLDEDLTQETTAELVVVAPGHSYVTEVTPPTATTDGYTTYTCELCGDSYVGDTVPALGETYTVSFSVPVDAADIEAMSCTKTGITLPEAEVPAHVADTYEFLGWTTAAVDNSSEMPDFYEAGSTYIAPSDITLYALYVCQEEGGGEAAYLLVEDLSQLTAGSKIVIASATKSQALSTTQNKNNRGQASITKNNDKTITLTGGVAELVLGEGTKDGTWSFYCPTEKGYLYAASSSKNYLRSQTKLDANASFAIVLGANGSATVTAQGSNTRNLLRYNPSSSIFGCYSQGQDPVCFYIETAAGSSATYTTNISHPHEVIYQEAVDATCTEAGNVEYWYCPDCQLYWLDQDLTQKTTAEKIAIAPGHNNITHEEESCYNVEYWFCERCQTWWADEALTQIINSEDVVKAEPSHALNHVEESCYNEEHWYCELCQTWWADEALTQNTNRMNVIKAVPSHEAVHTAESCYNTEYWYCAACDTYFADEALTQNTNRLNVIKAVPTHNLVHVEAKDPTCAEEGNIEHWYCTECEQVWQDEALTQLTNHKNVIIAIDEDAHEWGKWETTKKATCTAKGKETRICAHDDDHKETRDIAKLDHTDKDKDEKCDVCKADLTNSKTADTIMITVMVMMLAATSAVVLFFLMEEPKGKYLK